MILAGFFPAAALLALFGLCAVARHDVPRIAGSVALIITMAALGAAILR
ncbi:hypothetical protein ACIOKD_16645 [Streptomyces sp. NPDC087844]